MPIPLFPDFAPVGLEFRDEMRPLALTADGVSEYTFAGIYLFRRRYQYRVSREPEGGLVISGERDGKRFFCTPQAAPSAPVLEALFNTHDYWKGISDTVLEGGRAALEALGVEISEDRDNFDYLYLRSDLSTLAGKKFHKKRNLVNAFLLACPEHHEAPLTASLVPQALAILEHWQKGKDSQTDYAAAREALERFDELEMRGALYYVEEVPAAYCLGESLAGGRMFAVHFEKARDEFKGIYQYVNQSFAASLEEKFEYINREQDLGEEGMRQAKMTYRPVGFVRKCVGRHD